MSKELIHENEGRSNAFRMDPHKVLIIGIDTNDGPEHPLWDERIHLPVPESLVLSAMAIGIRQTINTTVIDGVPYVVDGRQRVRAARLANDRLRAAGEPALTVTVSGESAKKISPSLLQTAMVALNEIRQNDDILVKAAKAGRMRARGISNADIAIAFGVSEQTIRDWALLEGLHEDVRTAIRLGTLSASAARVLSALPFNDQPAELAKLLSEVKPEGRKPTANDVKRNIGRGGNRPSGRLIKKILEIEPDALDLSPDFILALKWVRGEISPKKIKGLTAVIASAEARKKKGALPEASNADETPTSSDENHAGETSSDETPTEPIVETPAVDDIEVVVE